MQREKKNVLNVIVAVQAAVINTLFFKKVLTFSVEAGRESHHAADTDDCTSMFVCAELKTSIIFLMSGDLLEDQTESKM